MIGNIIFSIIISIIIIILIHNIFLFFQNNLTIPKVKDFVNKPSKTYKEIFNIIETANTNTINNITNNNINNTNDNTTNINNIQPLPLINSSNTDNNLINQNKNDNSMKLELKNFLNNLANS